MRASSWNQISTGLSVARPAKCAFRVAEKFFECRDGLHILGRMARARADVREAELVQELAHRALVVDHAEALSDEMLQVHPPPAHDAVHGPIRSGLDEVGQRGLLLGGEAGRLALGPAVLQSVRAMLIEAVDPIAKGLAVH